MFDARDAVAFGGLGVAAVGLGLWNLGAGLVLLGLGSSYLAVYFGKGGG